MGLIRLVDRIVIAFKPWVEKLAQVCQQQTLAAPGRAHGWRRQERPGLPGMGLGGARPSLGLAAPRALRP